MTLVYYRYSSYLDYFFEVVSILVVQLKRFVCVRYSTQTIMKGRYQTQYTSVPDPDPMFLGLPDPHPDPLVTSTDPYPSLFS